MDAMQGKTLNIEKGNFFSIAGPSGSGMMTILNMIGCIDTTTDGTVQVNGQETGSLKHKVLTSFGTGPWVPSSSPLT
ncbi:MAG: ATP-binding cassette domain-containing protein [Spirochaeta sp.]|nr:ATP-binding cassette domain-containing protein [Spirochaeta sp.]